MREPALFSRRFGRKRKRKRRNELKQVMAYTSSSRIVGLLVTSFQQSSVPPSAFFDSLGYPFPLLKTSDQYSLHFIETQLLSPSVIELGGKRAGLVGRGDGAPRPARVAQEGRVQGNAQAAVARCIVLLNWEGNLQSWLPQI
jgi:hypothetical protein